MSGGITRSRVSSEQLDLLLSFMEEHPDFAAGKLSVYSRFTSCKLWRLLAERLNAAASDSGGAHKSPDKWCRYWADLKHKARKKSAAGGSLGDLSTTEERLQNIFNNSAGGARPSADERKPPLDDDMCSEASGGAGSGGPGAGVGGPGAGGTGACGAEELLTEAAMRSALAAEKQAEAVAQAVELLREVVALLRERGPPPPAPPYHHRL